MNKEKGKDRLCNDDSYAMHLNEVYMWYIPLLSLKTKEICMFSQGIISRIDNGYDLKIQYE